MNDEFTNEINETEGYEESTGSSGLGMGVGMLIGSLLTAGGYFAGKGVKKLWNNHKAKKQEKEQGEVEDFEGETVDEE